MSLSAHHWLARVGRWPRRIAALLCLLLAAGSALVPTTHAKPIPVARGIGARLHSGEVAVPVPVSSASAGGIRPGDLIGVLAGPPDGSDAKAVLVADRVRVLAVTGGRTALGGDTTTVIQIATDRVRALQLARYSSRPLVLIIDDPP